MIFIASKRDGFHRGGVRHPLGITKYPDGTFTEQQMDKIKREPMLTVEYITDDKAKASGEVKPPDTKAETSQETKTPDSKKAPEKGENASNAKKKNA